MSRLFDHTSDNYKIQGTSAVATYPFTLSAWTKNNGTANQTVFDIHRSGNNDHSHVRCYLASSTSIAFTAYSDTGGSNTKTISSYTAGTYDPWIHVAAVITSASSRKFWVNGIDSSTAGSTLTITGLDTMSFGIFAFTTDRQGHDGDIAEGALYDVALSDEDVKSLASGLSPLMVRRDALAGYWPLLGNSSPEPDLIAGNNGTVTNATKSAHAPVVYPSKGQIVSAIAAGGGTNINLSGDAVTFAGQNLSLLVGHLLTLSGDAITFSGGTLGIDTGGVTFITLNADAVTFGGGNLDLAVGTLITLQPEAITFSQAGQLTIDNGVVAEPTVGGGPRNVRQMRELERQQLEAILRDDDEILAILAAVRRGRRQ